MKAYQVVKCSCDGGQIGKTWTQYFYFDKAKAEAKLKEIVDAAYEREKDRTSDWQFRIYKPGTVDGISGWCAWCYGDMVYVKEIEIV